MSETLQDWDKFAAQICSVLPQLKRGAKQRQKRIRDGLYECACIRGALLDHGFALCGSRYFGDAKWNSDWDYFIEYSEEAADLLHRLGFRADHTHGMSDYRDGNTLEIFRWLPAENCDWPEWVEHQRCTQIHAALVASRRLREHAREILKDEPKSVRSDPRSWDLIYARLAAASFTDESQPSMTPP